MNQGLQHFRGHQPELGGVCPLALDTGTDQHRQRRGQRDHTTRFRLHDQQGAPELVELSLENFEFILPFPLAPQPAPRHAEPRVAAAI